MNQFSVLFNISGSLSQRVMWRFRMHALSSMMLGIGSMKAVSFFSQACRCLRNHWTCSITFHLTSCNRY